MKKFLAGLLIAVIIVTCSGTTITKADENKASDANEKISQMLNESDSKAIVSASEDEILSQMVNNGEVSKSQLRKKLKALSTISRKELNNQGYSDKQIAEIKSYNGTDDPILYVKSSSSKAKVSITYGLAGSDNTKKRVRVAYDIKWSKCPILTLTDSYGIGWIGADKKSHEVMTKIISANGTGSVYTVKGKYVGTRKATIDKNGAGVVRGKIAIGSAGGNYVKRIGGTIIVNTQSNSKNMQTIQLFVGYVHTYIKISSFSIGFSKSSGSISFSATKANKLLVSGSHTFNYNSQGQWSNKQK